MSRLLLTGGAGFIGSQLARTLTHAGHEVRVLDKLTYAGRRAHLEGVDCELVVGDVCDPVAVAQAVRGCEIVVHAAAESHVTRSLGGAEDFLRTNVEGTRVVLEAAAEAGVPRFLHVSTDEVFGEAADGQAFGPEDPCRPGNPYAASKLGAEALVHAWRHSWSYPAAIVRCTNNYGPRQHPEKAVPCWSLAALAGGPVPVHGRGEAVRDWLHVADFADGISRVLARWRPGATWHFAGRQPRQNVEVARALAALVGEAELAFGEERRGQDARYALDDAATREELDWAPQISLAQGLKDTLEWYRAHAHEVVGTGEEAEWSSGG